VQKAEAAHELALKTGDEDKIEKTSADVAKAESARADFAGQCVKCIQTKVNRRKLIVERGIVDQEFKIDPWRLDWRARSRCMSSPSSWQRSSGGKSPPLPLFPPCPRFHVSPTQELRPNAVHARSGATSDATRPRCCHDEA